MADFVDKDNGPHSEVEETGKSECNKRTWNCRTWNC